MLAQIVDFVQGGYGYQRIAIARIVNVAGESLGLSEELLVEPGFGLSRICR